MSGQNILIVVVSDDDDKCEAEITLLLSNWMIAKVFYSQIYYSLVNEISVFMKIFIYRLVEIRLAKCRLNYTFWTRGELNVGGLGLKDDRISVKMVHFKGNCSSFCEINIP